jgi:hypothetical protein
MGRLTPAHTFKLIIVININMKQQIDMTITLTLWIDARKDRRGIETVARNSIQRGFGERFTLMKIIDVKEEAEIYGNDHPRPRSSVDDGRSPAPWTYGYNPYTVQKGDSEGEELPAFEVFDAEGTKVFDTNEDTPCEVQEGNARLASAAPDMLEALRMAQMALNTAPRFTVGDTDSYRIAAIVDAAIAEAK